MAISAQAMGVFSSGPGEGAAATQTEERRRRHEASQQQLWDPALYAAQQQRLAAEQYGLEAQQMTTAAQRQLGAGLQQTRADIMAGAGGRGLNPALGRAAGYAGGQLGQAGVGMARALQARELAAAQAQQQQALAAQAQLMMGISEQSLGATAAEAQAYQAYQALAQQQAAQQQAQQMGYLGAGLGAASTFGAMAGQGWGGGGGGPTWTPEYQQQYQQWAQTYSDRELKQGVRQPLSAAEAELLNALRAEGARTESALEAATGRATGPQQATDARVRQLAQQLQAEGQRTEQRLGARIGTGMGTDRAVAPWGPATGQPWGAATGQTWGPATKRDTLGSLSGAGRQYSYTPEAQQRLGQPPGLQYGPMAQDLAKTELGASAVVPTPQGYAVNTGRLSLIEAGLIGEQQRQIEEIKRQLQAEGARTERRLGGGR